MPNINLATVIELFESLNSYVFVFDSQLQIVWKNNFAREDKGFFSMHGDIATSFISDNKSDVFAFCASSRHSDYTFNYLYNKNSFSVQIKHAYANNDGDFFLAVINKTLTNNSYDGSALLNHKPFANREYLSNIFVSLEALEYKLADNDRYELLPYINNAVLNCQKIYKDSINLSEYAKLKSGSIHLNLKPTVVQMLLGDIVERISHVNDKISITLDVEDNAKGLVSNIDPEKMFVAFMNIITNAVKFNSPEVKIKITISAFEDKIAITFLDDGFGIPKNLCEKVFDPFFVLEQNFAVSKGMGLGLPVAKEIILAHGGKIRLFSGENTGAQIAVHLNTVQADSNKVSTYFSLGQNNTLSLHNVFLSDIQKND